MNPLASLWMGLLSLAAESPGQQQPQQAWWVMPAMIIGMLVVMYLIMIRPQQKRQREHMDMVASLRKGDRVVTRGGIHGVVTLVRDKEVVIKVDDACRLTLSKPAIAAVIREEKPEGRKEKEKGKEDETKEPEKGAAPTEEAKKDQEEGKGEEEEGEEQEELCDLCRQPGKGQVMRSKDISRAARKGFVPPKVSKVLESVGLTGDTWRSQAIEGRLSKPEWRVCDDCMNELRSYL